MKIVRLENNKVAEIIPEYSLPVKDWYGEEFAFHCVSAPDEVQQDWTYNHSDKTFSEPSIPIPVPYIPTNQELASENKLLRAQIQATTERNDFMEGCIAEMATLVYTA